MGSEKDNSALSDRDAPSDELVEAVAVGIAQEITQPSYATLDEVPGKDAAIEAARGLARAAIAAYRANPSPDPGGVVGKMVEALKHAIEEIDGIAEHFREEGKIKLADDLIHCTEDCRAALRSYEEGGK